MSLDTYRRVIGWVWQLAWAQTPRLLIGFLVATLLESLLPAALVLTGRGLINTLVTAQQGGDSFSSLLPWLVLGATLAISQTLISNQGDYWQQCIQDELDLQAGLAVLNQAARLDLAYLESSEAQDYVERTRRYGNTMMAQVLFKLVTVGNQSIRLCSLMGILFWIEPLVVGWLALLAIPYWLFKWQLSDRTYDMRRRRIQKQRQTAYYTQLLTQPKSLPEVKFFGLVPLFIEQFRLLSREFIGADRELRRLSLLGSAIFTTIGVIALYALFGRIAGRVLSGDLTVGDVAIYTGSAMQLQGVVESLVQTIAGLNEQMQHLVDLQTFLSRTPAHSAAQASPPAVAENDGKTLLPPNAGPESPDHTTEIAAPGSAHRTVRAPKAVVSRSCQGWIEFDNVAFTYPNNEQPVLADLSFDLKPGEAVALVGENGAGKSTLALLLAGLYTPTSGVIRVDGIDLRTIDPAQWQAQVGFVFQKFTTYEATVRENIAYGNWPQLSDQPATVEALAVQAQAAHWIQKLPAGYETFTIFAL